MPAKQKERAAAVPRDAEPIPYLIANGWTAARLAVAWGCRSDSNVRKLAEYNHVPPHNRALLMAATFGWKSAGEVIDFWAEKKKQRARRKP